MKEEFKEYLTLLYQRIPDYIFYWGAVVSIVGVLLLLLFWGPQKGLKRVCSLFLVEYFFLIICSTVIFRITIGTAAFRYIPFDSYKDITQGDQFYIQPELLMNILVFIPLGLLCVLAFRGLKWWHALLMGCGASVTIEVLQYCFRRGTAEVDDVIHNVLGFMIGYGLFKATVFVFQKCGKKSIEEECVNIGSVAK